MSSFEYAFVPFSSEHNLHTGCFKTREKFKIAISELNDHRIFKQNGLFCHKCLAFLCFKAFLTIVSTNVIFQMLKVM